MCVCVRERVPSPTEKPRGSASSSIMFMTLNLITFFLVSLFPLLLVNSKPTSDNITVIGSVFCDSCSDTTFSNRSYFLQGAEVRIQCRFKANSALSKDICITADKITDKYGVYKLDIPPINGFKCQQGRVKKSPCQATLIQSPSSHCNLTGLPTSATHIAIRLRKANLCILNFNALNYRPPKRDVGYCGAHNTRPLSTGSLESSLFFWPLLPPFFASLVTLASSSFRLPSIAFPLQFNTVARPIVTSTVFSTSLASTLFEPIVSSFPILTVSSLDTTLNFLCSSTTPTKLTVIATSSDLM